MSPISVKTFSSVVEVNCSDVNRYLKDGWVVLQTVKKFDDGEEYSKCLIGAPCGIRELKKLYNVTKVNEYLKLGWKLLDTFKVKDPSMQWSEEPMFLLCWDNNSQPPAEPGMTDSNEF